MVGYTVDSRKVKPGTLFFALKGARVDGHEFLADVAERGASGAVVSKNYNGPDYGLSLTFVDDVLGHLQHLAKEQFSLMKLRTVGITGSLGKTTTKAFLESLLKPHCSVASSPGNQNSQVGVPLAVLNTLSGNEEIYLQEMAMTEPGQIARLTTLVPPEIALITTVGLVHAKGFASLKKIAETKGEVAHHPKTRQVVVDHAFSKLCRVERPGCEVVTFSLKFKQADFYLDSALSLFERGEQIDVKVDLPFQAPHLWHNFLGAAAVARLLGLSWQKITASTQDLKLVEGRGEIVKRGGITFVNDAYNAALPSVKAALASIPNPVQGGRKIAVLGEMPELGVFSEGCHREAGRTALRYVDQVYTLGHGARFISEECKRAGQTTSHFLTRSSLVEALKEELKLGDVVLLKGGNLFQLWTLIDEVV